MSTSSLHRPLSAAISRPPVAGSFGRSLFIPTTVSLRSLSSTHLPRPNPSVVLLSQRPLPSSPRPSSSPSPLLSHHRTMTSLPSSMKAILIKDGVGPASNLYIDDHALPSLEEDEVLVKVHSFALNRMDILQREGKYPLPPSAPKDIMGVEFSGIVVSTKGSQAESEWKQGDEVFGLATGGAYAQYIEVPHKMILHKPKELSWEQAASIPEAFLTAFQALKFISDIKQGEDVLIHAGASGVGLAAIQLARAFGAKDVYVTAGSEEKVKFCEELGATKGFNYKTSDWGAELGKATNNQGVDIILDFIGAPYYDSNIKSLKRDGRLVFLAFMGGSKKEVDLAHLLFKRLHLEGTTLRSRSLEYQSRLVQEFVASGALDNLVKGVGSSEEEGSHRIQIHKIYNWKDIKEAHEEMEANKNTGKIVMTIE